MIWLLVAACYSGDLDLDKGFPRSETWPLDDDLESTLPVGDTDEEDPLDGDLDPDLDGDLGGDLDGDGILDDTGLDLGDDDDVLDPDGGLDPGSIGAARRDYSP